MKSFLLFIFTTVIFYASAQPPRGGGPQKITGRISGILIDSASNEILPYAAVVLQNPATGKDINGTITESDGSFRFNLIPVGTYQMVISFVGYTPKKMQVTTTDKNPDLDLGSIRLVSETTQLDEVVVKGQRDLVESRIDKIVYNAEEDVANIGGDGADVLRRAPLLNVDLDGNVSLRGSSNVQILINGKPSSMFSSNPGDALRSIPADQIKKVEVITTPGAKYDGEGTAGIINIITEKSGPEGFSGNADLSVGNRSNRGSLNLNAGKGRFGVNASLSSYYGWPIVGTSEVDRVTTIDGQEIRWNDSGEVESDYLGYFGNLGAFYDFNAYNSITTSFRLRGRSSNADGYYITTEDDPLNQSFSQYGRDQISETSSGGYEWSLDYIKKFAGMEGRELSMSYKIDGSFSNQENFINQEDLLGEDPQFFQDNINLNDGDNSEYTLQIDYVHPVSDKIKIETGAKGVMRDVVSDFRFLEREQGQSDYEVVPSATDKFNYDQDVSAGYISANIGLGENWGLLTGVRYEHTYIRGSLEEQANPFTNEYDNFLPNITLSRNFSQTTTLKASYNKRIQRPGLRQINPFVERNNVQNISYGNPQLDPEITHQYELNLNIFIKKILLNTSVYYRRATDVIQQITIYNEEFDRTETTFENIGSQDVFGLNVFSSVTLFDKWTIRGGVNMNTFEATGVVEGQEVSRTAYQLNGNINSNLKLDKNWVIDLFGFYRAEQQTIQGYIPSFTLMAMGIRKTFWEDRASLGIRIIEPFFENKTFEGKVEGSNFVQTTETVRPFRSFGLSFSYKFGKLDFRARQRRSRIENDDVKESGSGEQQQF